jgi:Zn-dependent protease
MRSWKIGSVFGIGLYLHWTLLLLPVWVVFSTAHAEGPGPLFYLLVTAAVFGCVMLHELGHALAAKCFGIGTRDITMYPIGGVARLERMSEKPLEEFFIAVAGPAVNVVIALLLAAVVIPLAAANPAGFLDSLAGKFLAFVLFSNVVLVVFNMIPAFPMDGGRVFRALLSSFLGHLQATRIAAGVAAVVAMLLGLVGIGAFAGTFEGSSLEGFFHGNPMLVLVAGFVFLMGQRELQMVEMRERARHEEPLMVLPVRRPRAEAGPVLDLQPTIAVYTWDAVNGIWVRDGTSRPVRRVYPPDAESRY